MESMLHMNSKNTKKKLYENFLDRYNVTDLDTQLNYEEGSFLDFDQIVVNAGFNQVLTLQNEQGEFQFVEDVLPGDIPWHVFLIERITLYDGSYCMLISDVDNFMRDSHLLVPHKLYDV